MVGSVWLCCVVLCGRQRALGDFGVFIIIIIIIILRASQGHMGQVWARPVSLGTGRLEEQPRRPIQA
jgi:hypothetical protein